MSYTEKIDVLDLIIEILQEHERKIDLLVERIEVVADRLDPQGQSPEGYIPEDPVSEAELSRRFYAPL